MTDKIAFVTDFDGTISFDDFFFYVTDKYMDKSALAPWEDFMAGDITHIEALNRIFANINVPEQELLEFIDTIRCDKDFEKTIQLCIDKNIPVAVCSAGCDYYINRRIGNLISKYNLLLVTNHGEYNPQTGLKMTAPAKDSPFYDDNIGISKAAIVKKFQEEGYKVIYAGDGLPDFEPSKIADVVFAKKYLLKMCLKNNIKTQKFDGYIDIYNYIKEL